MAAFAATFEQAAADRLREQELIPQLLLDAELAPGQLTLQLVQELQGLGPFGMANQTPVLLLQGMKVGDLDPRCDRSLCFIVSDKALAVGGGVLEALFSSQTIRQSLRGPK